MRTNIVLNEKLVKKAFKQSPDVKTKKELVNRALEEYVASRERAKVDFSSFFGADLIDPNYDYKATRS